MPTPDEPLCEWVEPGLREIAGQDPLGIQTITTDRILPALLPGVLALSRRARYFSIYAFLLRRYEQNAGRATNQGLDDFIRHREFELGAAANLCTHCGGDGAIGNRVVSPLVAQAPANYPRQLSVKSTLGGYGLYYRSPMEELGIVVPAGHGYVKDEPTPVDLLAPPARAQRLADAFESAIDGTRWYRDWMHGVDPIPADVLKELSQVACLCRLHEYPEERQAIRDVLLSSPAPERDEPTEQRRRAFALLLDLMRSTPDVADADGSFRNAVIDAFDHDPRGSGARASSIAQWAAAAMRDSLQDALSVIWLDFCRTGLQVQPFAGLTRPELRALIRQRLVADATLEINGINLTAAPDDPIAAWVDQIARACAELSWQSACDLAIDADSAMSGLAVLLGLTRRVPERDDASTAWLRVARVDGDHQPGLLRMIRMLRRQQAQTGQTVGSLMQWVIDTFIVRAHDTVAMSKLPESTFRFSWEEGRLRFVDNGVWRFQASGLRRQALAGIAYDLGWWTRADTDTPRVAVDGMSVIEAVFRA
ncbi:MAG: hypothetical protein U0T02_12210 [Solirubrobacteraceae bacterium]